MPGPVAGRAGWSKPEGATAFAEGVHGGSDSSGKAGDAPLGMATDRGGEGDPGLELRGGGTGDSSVLEAPGKTPRAGGLQEGVVDANVELTDMTPLPLPLSNGRLESETDADGVRRFFDYNARGEA